MLRGFWPASDPAGMLDLLPRLLQCTSVSEALREPVPPQLSPLGIGAMPSLVTRPQDRGRLVSLRPFTGGETKAQKGNPPPGTT